MSLIVDNPNDDISTDTGVKPTLGGGPVSAWAMDTAIATATYWSDLATINLGSIDDADASFRLLLSCGEGTSLTTVDLLVVCKQTTTISSTESKIEVLSLTNTTNVTHDDFKIIASATTKGTGIHLWMQSETSVKWRVIELSRQINSDSSTPINYNNGSTWTVTTPTGTVDITSDWSGRSAFTPILSFGGASTGITYSTQLAYESRHNGLITVNGYIVLTNKGTATGDAAISLSTASASTNNTFSVGNLRFFTTAATVPDVYCQNSAGSSSLALFKNNGSATLGAIQDTDFVNASSLMFSITYRE